MGADMRTLMADMRVLISAFSCLISLRADMKVLISAPISAPHIVHKNIKIVVISSKSTVPAGDLDLKK